MPPPPAWREVADQDALADELRAYGEARRLLRLYTMLLQQIFKHRAVSDALAAVDALAAAIAALPEEPDLMHVFPAYLDFSQTDRRSRSWLLFTLPGLRDDLTLARRSLTPAELANRGFEGMYDKTTKAYEAWRALAEPRLRVPQAALRAREERPRSRHAQLPRLLQQLASHSKLI
jgi:hypothetical protein